MEHYESNIFTEIYRTKFWSNGSSDVPLSGPGSDPDVAKPYVDFVAGIIKANSVGSVVDIGHGDWSMWRDYKFEDTFYVGYDIAEGLSKRNSNLFGLATRRFMLSSNQTLFLQSELLICKDVLQHLSFFDIGFILAQLEKYKLVILCNDFRQKISILEKFSYIIQIRARLSRLIKLKWPFYIVKYPYNNIDITTGEYRSLDLEDERFKEYFKNFEIVEKFDFAAEHSSGTVKRVYFLKNLFGSE